MRGRNGWAAIVRRTGLCLLGGVLAMMGGMQGAQAQFDTPLPISPDCPSGTHWGWIQPGTGKIVNSLAEGGNPGCVPDNQACPPGQTTMAAPVREYLTGKWSQPVCKPIRPPENTTPVTGQPTVDLFAACRQSFASWKAGHPGSRFTELVPIRSASEVKWEALNQGALYGWLWQFNLTANARQNGNLMYVDQPRPFVLQGVSSAGSGGAFAVGYLYCEVNPATGAAGAVNADWQRGCYQSGGQPGTQSGCGH